VGAPVLTAGYSRRFAAQLGDAVEEAHLEAEASFLEQLAQVQRKLEGVRQAHTPGLPWEPTSLFVAAGPGGRP